MRSIAIFQFFEVLAASVAPATLKLVERQASPSLDKLITAKSKLYFGAATEVAKFKGNKDEPILAADFGQVTHEYSMKWATTEPSRGKFNFDAADALVDWAETKGFSIRGHCLLWYMALPDWVSAIKDAGTLTSVIQKHISTVVGRYKGRIRAWVLDTAYNPHIWTKSRHADDYQDVVNEAFLEDGSWRRSVFYNVLGEDYIRIAFQAARAADPKAKLYYNDYNLDNVSWPQLSVGVVPHVKQWIASGIPIDGIGSQSHLAAGRVGGVQAALKALAGTGISEVAITELDIAGANHDDYWAVANACMQVHACVGITTWGISDRDSWRASVTPLLFNTNYQPKDAYYAVADALKR